MILLHYTGMPDAEGASAFVRASSEVSAHYFVFEDGRIVQMVPESRRAWHAGASSWAGETDINSCSIGIEIANPGHDYGYPDFPKRQIAAVTALCRGIQTRNTVPPARVLAHSDVAPARKQDPGEKFPWRTLFDSGVGNWVKPAPITEGGRRARARRPQRRRRVDATVARKYGYGVWANGIYDSATHEVVTAFQRHFRPERVDGVSDESTRATLQGAARSSQPAGNHGGARPIRPRLRATGLLTAAANLPSLFRQSVGRPLRRNRKVAGEESPGSMDKRCRITSGGREPRESATENRPPRRVA
jgi:N-acetylmuramoyl-L-alanine amidase